MNAAADYYALKRGQFRSGFCGISNPDDSHRRCLGGHDGTPCVCRKRLGDGTVCHEAPQTASPGEPAPGPAKAPAVTTPGLYDLTNADYHADPVAGGSLSASGAKKLLPPYCPAIYKWERDHPVFKDVFDFGSAAHQLVLGDAATELVVVDADDWRTKAAREAKAEARAFDKVPILRGDYVQVQAMAEAILAHPVARVLFDPEHGKSEQSAFWTDDETGVWRRARFDWLPEPRGGRLILPDYKTSVSANPATFGKKAADFGYHMQAAWYLDAVVALGLDDDPAFVFVVQEKTEPYLVTVVELDEEALQIGRNLNRRALALYADCARTDTWPGYSADVEPVSLPYYYTRQHSLEIGYR